MTVAMNLKDACSLEEKLWQHTKKQRCYFVNKGLYHSYKVRSSGCALLEQLWRDTPAQGKRIPSKMIDVARGHQRADTLKPYSQKSSQSNHTRTTALSNSMKLSHAPAATQDGRVILERCDRMWSTGERNGKPLQYSCLESPINSMKRDKDRTLKD